LIGWDDLGDFSSLAALLPAEKNHPVILGDQSLGMSSRPSSIPLPIIKLTTYVVVHEQVVGGIVVPLSKRVVACLGVDDLVIVDTPDALLVTTRARSQDLKKLVHKCRENGWKKVL
jgi:mannose-1-phosphate guanylyltransferase